MEHGSPPSGASTVSLVPPRRLGRLLRQHREAVGLTVRQVARRGGRALSPAILRRIEDGQVAVGDRMVDALVRAYGVEPGELVPRRLRLEIDLDDAYVATGDREVPLGLPREPEVDRALRGVVDPEGVLTRYLALVYALRDREPGVSLAVREGDAAVLAEALDRTVDEVTDRLRQLMVEGPEGLHVLVRLVRRRPLVPDAGVLVTEVPSGSLVMVRDPSSR